MILSTEVRREPGGTLLLILTGLHPFAKDEDLVVAYTGADEFNGAYRVRSVTTVMTDSYATRKVWVSREDERRVRR